MRRLALPPLVALTLSLLMLSGADAQSADPYAPLPSWTEAQVVDRLRFLLRRRGFSPAVVAGPMAAAPPGEGSPDDFGSDGLAGAYQPDAWLVSTEAGRFWFWEYGAAAPADQRAAAEQDYLLHTLATGRFIAN
jgi:hypothetical protein